MDALLVRNRRHLLAARKLLGYPSHLPNHAPHLQETRRSRAPAQPHENYSYRTRPVQQSHVDDHSKTAPAWNEHEIRHQSPEFLCLERKLVLCHHIHRADQDLARLPTRFLESLQCRRLCSRNRTLRLCPIHQHNHRPNNSASCSAPQSSAAFSPSGWRNRS
jgi:hypothetical protein